jgi:hypothetical protein
VNRLSILIDDIQKILNENGFSISVDFMLKDLLKTSKGRDEYFNELDLNVEEED